MCFAILFTGLLVLFAWENQSALAGQGAGFQSLASPIGQPLWVDGGQNDRALNCYLTSETTRLCRKAEREHLSGVLSSYRSESRKFTGQSLWSLYFEPGGPQGGISGNDLDN